MQLPAQIEHENIRLRPLQEKDFDCFYEFLSDDRAVGFFALSAEERSRKGAQRFFNHILDSYQTENPIFALAILDKKKDQIVGCCGLTTLDREEVLESIVMVLPRFWNSGYGTVVSQMLIDYTFANLDHIEKVVAFAAKENNRAEELAKRLNMTYDGWVSHDGYQGQVKRFSIKRESQLQQK